jgi:CubicO group peptidase (beta-lactamase class C family)
MQDIATRAVELQGRSDPRFDHLREVFARHFTEHDELGAAVAVTLGGEPVVDLWGGWKDKARTEPWTRETRAPLFSGTKAITGLCFAMVIDRGRASYDDLACRYWPEFGMAGKDVITIGQLLSHSAGLTGWVEPMTVEDMLNPEIARARLLPQAPFWTPGTACGYHAFAVGPVLGAIFQAIEGRTLRRFVAEEIAGPFGLSVSIGLEPEDYDEAAEVVTLDKDFDFGNFFKGKGSFTAEKPTNPNLSPAQAAVVNPVFDGRYANTPLWRGAELPSANGFGTARSLAQIYALVLGHPSHGKVLASPEALAEATRVRAEGMDQVKSAPSRWSAGFSLNDGLYGPNRDTFYHAGMGGTFSLGDPAADLTISYTPNRLGDLFEREPRRRGLVDAVYACLGR